jgi:flavoprotein hydroxylase
VLAADGRVGLLDDIIGTGWCILADGERVDAAALALDPAQAVLLTALGAHLVRVVPAQVVPEDGPVAAVADIDGVLLAHLRACGHAIQIVRPDFYIFGGIAGPDALAGLLGDLERALSMVAVRQ